MYYVQKGWKVTISRWIASMFILGISLCLLLYGIGLWFSISNRNEPVTLITATFFYALFIAGMLILVTYHLRRFPNILTSEKGLELKTFFYTMHISWKDIVKLQRANNMLIIFLGDNGYFFNRLYGLFDAKVWDQPVTLYVSDEDMIQSLEHEIKIHWEGASKPTTS
jgi:hypothetical protein